MGGKYGLAVVKYLLDLRGPRRGKDEDVACHVMRMSRAVLFRGGRLGTRRCT